MANSNSDAAFDAKDALEQKTHRELTDGIRAICKSLAAADLKALESLALYNERAAIQHFSTVRISFFRNASLD